MGQRLIGEGYKIKYMTGAQQIQVQANTGSQSVGLNYVIGQSVWDYTFDFTFRAIVENLNQMSIEISGNVGQANLISQIVMGPPEGITADTTLYTADTTLITADNG